MPKRSSKPRDINALAFSIVQEATIGGISVPTKNPAAVALGRLGGIKGGKARAKSLTPEARSDIARIAAASRWKAKNESR